MNFLIFQIFIFLLSWYWFSFLFVLICCVMALNLMPVKASQRNCMLPKIAYLIHQPRSKILNDREKKLFLTALLTVNLIVKAVSHVNKLFIKIFEKKNVCNNFLLEKGTVALIIFQIIQSLSFRHEQHKFIFFKITIDLIIH
jgi:hypothetical protein